MRTYIYATLLFVLTLSQAALALAVPPPTLNQLLGFEEVLECRATCEHGKQAVLAACLAACPVAGPEWDKDKDGDLDRRDHTLAYLEYLDDGDLTSICYENGAVVPIQACGLSNCLAGHTAIDCQDVDGDGMRRYQELLIGTSDTTANPVCNADAQCGGFSAACTFVPPANRSICRPRTCSGPCTAFHLEKVSSDNNELIVRVHYDYSPVPATILDLHIVYSQAALTLIDARPLAALTARGKTLQTRHTGTGKLRLMVLSATSSRAIPQGAIVELVFTRIAPTQASVAFSKSDFDQEWSMAPDPGLHKPALRNDALWGTAATVGAVDATGPRLVLYYSFDDAQSPLSYKSVPTGQALADLSFVCTNPANCTLKEQADKAHLAAQADALQAGSVSVAPGIAGVYGSGVTLDGATNHLEMPISLNGTGPTFVPQNQGFSLSLWAYHEPNVARTSSLHGDLLFSHNHGVSELTRFGLLAVPHGTSTFDLVWFEGDLGDSNLPKTVVKAGLSDRRWTQVGLAVDGTNGSARVYVDGEAPAGVTLQLAGAPSVQCPTITNSGKLSLKNQGTIEGGRAPEQLMFSSSENNLFGIERMEPRGLDRKPVLRLTTSSATDPDYSSVVDRIVYAGSSSGNYEVWVAHSDGSEPVQITNGFGDTGRGIFARRPRWAPDGSAIVFESNVFDVGASDNTYARGYQLYYVAYNPIANQPAIPLPDGTTVTQLVYSTLLSTDSIRDYRLTKADRNHSNAVWLRGAFSENEQSYLGELVLNTADRKFEDKRVARVRIASPINSVTAEPMSVFASVETGASVSMLAASRIGPANQAATQRLFLQKEWVTYQAATGISVQVVSSAGTETAVITYSGVPMDALCYDHNRNHTCDGAAEDRNGDGSCDASDCTPAEINDLFVVYSPEVVAPTFNADGGVVATPGAWLATGHKQLRLADVHTSEQSLIKVELASPINDRPIPVGTELARIPLRRLGGGGGAGVSLVVRRTRQELYVKTDGAEPTPFVVQEGHMERVLEADFSPDGTRLALAGIQGARPVVATTENLTSTAGLDKASILPMRVQGLDWERVERLFPCNWVGAYRNPYSGFYVSAFHGGLDEIRVHSYPRTAAAFQSEAERGRERLNLDGRGGVLVGNAGTCSADLDCPPYQLCSNAGHCTTQTCNPQDPYSCERGLCNLQPVPVSLDTAAVRWVCSVDCVADSQCFQQECLNGPCRFCSDNTQSCIECRETVQNVGGLNIAGIEGCPDRNSFACEQGSCVTECYSNENGQSKYLCDTSTEYCRQGRCVLFEWSWEDLAPATLAGLGETSFDLPNLGTTQAISQLYPIEIEAYGVEDYGHAPEMLVQGRVSTNGAQAYGEDWFDLGRVLVYNKTRGEAGSNKYVILSSQPVTRLRLRLVTPPYENMNSASTGLMAKDDAFCRSAAWSSGDRTACHRRASGSRASLGYPVSIPNWQSRQACKAKSRSDCPSFEDRQSDPLQAYLYGGQPAVVIRGLKIRGQSVLDGSVDYNRVCSYEGTFSPFDSNRPRKLFFGDIAKEQSNQRTAYFSSQAASALTNAKTLTNGSWALLNCNFANPDNPDDVAELVVSVPPGLYPNPGSGSAVEGAISENANGCFIELQGGVREPCREWIGADVSMDPFGAERQLHRTLDYQDFTSFGGDVDGPPPAATP